MERGAQEQAGAGEGATALLEYQDTRRRRGLAWWSLIAGCAVYALIAGVSLLLELRASPESGVRYLISDAMALLGTVGVTGLILLLPPLGVIAAALGWRRRGDEAAHGMIALAVHVGAAGALLLSLLESGRLPVNAQTFDALDRMRNPPLVSTLPIPATGGSPVHAAAPTMPVDGSAKVQVAEQQDMQN